MLTFIRFCNLWNEVLHCCSPVHILCYVSRSQSGSQWLMQTRNCPSQEYLSTLYFLLWEPTLNSGKSFSYLFSAAKFHIIFRKEERGHDVKWAILNALNKFKPKNSCDLKKNPSINMCCFLYSSDHQMIYICNITSTWKEYLHAFLKP